MKKPWVLSYTLSAQRRLWSDWANAQADMSLSWAHTHLAGFVIMSWLRFWLSTRIYPLSRHTLASIRMKTKVRLKSVRFWFPLWQYSKVITLLTKHARVVHSMWIKWVCVTCSIFSNNVHAALRRRHIIARCNLFAIKCCPMSSGRSPLKWHTAAYM